MYVISVAAELAGVHPQTLRIYERKGLLDPARTVGGSRRYSEQDIDQLRRIQDLTTAGLNLEGVRRVIELEDEVDRLRGRAGSRPPAGGRGRGAHPPPVPAGSGAVEKLARRVGAGPSPIAAEVDTLHQVLPRESTCRGD